MWIVVSCILNPDEEVKRERVIETGQRDELLRMGEDSERNASHCLRRALCPEPVVASLGVDGILQARFFPFCDFK